MLVAFNAKGIATSENVHDFVLEASTRVMRQFRPTIFKVQQRIIAVDSEGQRAYASSAVALDTFLTASYMGGDSTFPPGPLRSIENGSTAVNCAFYDSQPIEFAETPSGIDISLYFLVSETIIGSLRWATKPVGVITYTIYISAQLFGEHVSASFSQNTTDDK